MSAQGQLQPHPLDSREGIFAELAETRNTLVARRICILNKPYSALIPLPLHSEIDMPKATSETPAKRTRRSAAEGATKKKKDPNAPKRPLTAYLYFANDKRDGVRAKNPDLTLAQVTSLIGQQWRDLSSEDKKPYEEKAVADKKRYESERAAYKEKQVEASA